MFRFLRRYQPRHWALAILYWMVVTLVLFALLILLFMQVDRLLPPLL